MSRVGHHADRIVDFVLCQLSPCDGRGEEPSVPVRDLIGLLVENGYSGAVSSEYEGWHWNNWQSPFEIIATEQAVQRSAAEGSGSRMITDAAEARRIIDTHLGKAVQA